MSVEGDLSEVTVPSLLALMAENARPSLLSIKTSEGLAEIRHDGTAFVAASFGDEEGIGAVERVAVLSAGRFVIDRDQRPAQKNLFEGTAAILAVARKAVADAATALAADPYRMFTEEIRALDGVLSVVATQRDGTLLAAAGIPDGSTIALVGAFFVHGISESASPTSGRFISASLQYGDGRLSVFAEGKLVVLVAFGLNLPESRLLAHAKKAFRTLDEQIRSRS